MGFLLRLLRQTETHAHRNINSVNQRVMKIGEEVGMFIIYIHEYMKTKSYMYKI